MDITPLIPEDRQVIDSYGPGRFQIAGITYTGPVLVFPNAVLSWDVAESDDVFSALDPATLGAISAANPAIEVLLLGTGAKTEFVRPSLKASIKQSIGLTPDAMETGAACRTYNILLAEGRRVAAAMMPV
ncbi:hypothetical protein EOI86_08375 [Hwanghaeella grinnelliae]|uniref:Uncharacterized protein n=1 Tax=Hwanghaeella grinnelliae TaxID=2500179 RepID=A0A3S2ZAF3_9PROT|nr:Mth938-like domain-containing protein [Hwanghaeella grinnelliae]RVU39244.1 hypothetical protein EOI86_08375 [Hwanghaeella grinnelliae]